MPNALATNTLTAQQGAFVRLYTCLGSETFGNATKSALDAGYSKKSAQAIGSRLSRSTKIKKEIQKAYDLTLENNGLTVNSVLASLAHAKSIALRDKNIVAYVRATELEGRYYSMFTDRVMVDTDEIAQYTAREQAEMSAISRIRLEQSAKALPLIAERKGSPTSVDRAQGGDSE